MNDFYDFDFGFDNDYDDIDGFSFSLTSNFRIVDRGDGFFFEFHKLFKRSYKGYEKEMDIILKDNPLSISDIHNVELSEFKMNKLHKGFFTINFYDDNVYDIFLKDYNII